MIILTKLNDSRFAVNPDLVERIHSNPDTTLTLVDGTTYIVTESMEEVIDLIARYRARVISIARSLDAADPWRAAAGSVLPFPQQPQSQPQSQHQSRQTEPARAEKPARAGTPARAEPSASSPKAR